jgi:hypothetical protein
LSLMTRVKTRDTSRELHVGCRSFVLLPFLPESFAKTRLVLESSGGVFDRLRQEYFCFAALLLSASRMALIMPIHDRSLGRFAGRSRR